MSVEEARRIYDAVLPDDLPEEITCRFCGEPKQLIRANPRVAFWVHLDLAAFERCKTLTFRTSFVRDVAALWADWYRRSRELKTKMEERERGVK